ncbi:MAG: ECF-type sigma factor [Planctomycetota bacterium]|nr:ECF-type sigma factor [Planctomycetota bacterium]
MSGSVEGSHAVTRLLAAWREGSVIAPEQLMSMLYEDLHALAAQRLASPRAHQTLSPTALVHEAYIKLLGSASRGWEDRRHFVAAAVTAMRSVIVDRARARACLKRGGMLVYPSNPIETPATSLPPDEVLAIHEAISRLESIDPRAASVLSLRCFGGLTAEETSLVLDLSERVVRREWEFARRWLRDALGNPTAASVARNGFLSGGSESGGSGSGGSDPPTPAEGGAL